MTKQSPDGRYLVISDHHLQEQGAANVVPAGRYENLEDAIEHAESVTYRMGVMDAKAESRGYIYTNWGKKLPPKKYVPTQTPWGPSQSQREHAPGIVFYSTASHGGYKLSPERWAEFASIPHFAHWSQWLEEDCDACLVYLRWPELATDEQLHDAVCMARTVASWGNGRWVTLVEGWLDQQSTILSQTNTILDRAAQHARSVAHLWQRGSMSSQGNGWSVSFRRGEERRDVCMKDYPAKRYYSDAELDALHIQLSDQLRKAGFSRLASDLELVGNSYDFEPSDADPGL